MPGTRSGLRSARAHALCRASTSSSGSTIKDVDDQDKPGHDRKSLRSLSVGDVAAAITPDANVRLLGMTEKALKHAQARAVLADHGAGLVGQHFLIGACFHEFAHPQATG